MAKIKITLESICNNSKLSIADIEEVFEKVKKNIENKDYAQKLQTMFYFAVKNDLTLFPQKSVINSLDIPLVMVSDYLTNWCDSYINSREKLAINSPIKNYGEKDEALTKRVASVTGVDDDTLNKYIEGHFLFMSAENKNGAILEEYLAHVLEPHGWIWCAGSSFRAIDFCYLGEKPILLQVKNKYNTENSSSSAIRLGTKIQKWNRLNKPKKASGSDKPLPNWVNLQEIVQADKTLSEELSESEYLNYISKHSSIKIDKL